MGAINLSAFLEHDGKMLARRVWTASGVAAMRGLLGRDHLEPGEALYFPHATFGALHSFGMRFAFDALYLDRRGVIRQVLRAVPPGRLCAWNLWTVSALEMQAGAADGVRPGDAVRFATSE